uniref:Transmembrane protein n=1 Tax=Salix viminalis TaxID=40686 RepID=A0A6N2MZX1_SALVM
MKMEGPKSENAADLTSKETLIKRYKLKPIWRLFMIVNLGLGAYMFVKPKKKTTSKEANRDVGNDKVPVEAFLQASATSIPERPPPPVVLEERERVPEDQQHDLLKWILEEKRKVKPRDLEEKKRIDEEKAILKHFIRANS